MEPNTTTPDQGDESHPFFISKRLSFKYLVSYAYANKSEQIEYRSPLEVILNLRSFRGTDTITYVNMENGRNAFTMTVDRFKVMMAQLVVSSSVDEIESLYLRLLLTNHYSPSIPDRGYLKGHDRQLCMQLGKVRGGIDHHILGGGILYLKSRRMSVSYLRAVILASQREYDIQFYNINTPSAIPNRRLFREVIRLSIPDRILRVHSYNHRSEDHMVDTPIPGFPGRIIRIINTLIK
jgi:hypothetical protein